MLNETVVLSAPLFILLCSLAVLGVSLSVASFVLILKGKYKRVDQVKVAPNGVFSKDPYNLKSYPYLRRGLYSILDYMKTQDLKKIVSDTADPERSLLALDALNRSLIRISTSNGVTSENESLRERDVKVMDRMDKTFKEARKCPGDLMKSENPLVRVVAWVCEVDQVLDSIIKDS
jgi:hypothetical protein